ncbi:unnamed protein product [Penicillium camemberti]|uniref:Str. FM013 n=1 Tax=Penicillium camemberti (strain FM 013) TaxID=1429867 RepID=A0A0G4PMY5_PENC3|nr:unnamed protein product [Penicillium camemberti]
MAILDNAESVYKVHHDMARPDWHIEMIPRLALSKFFWVHSARSQLRKSSRLTSPSWV